MKILYYLFVVMNCSLYAMIENVSSSSSSSDLQTLHRACSEGNLNLVEFYFSTDPSLIHQTYNDLTALHKAILGGHKATCQFLLAKGAEADQKAIQLAWDNSKREILVILQTFKGTFNQGNQGDYVCSKQSSDSPKGRERSDVSNESRRSDRTPASAGIAEGAVVRKNELNILQKELNRKFLKACNAGKLDLVKKYVSSGADINIKQGDCAETQDHVELGPDRQSTGLLLASSNGHAAVCGFLIEKGADISAKDCLGKTSLHLASVYGHLSICQILLDHGADVKAKDYFDNTPLHAATARGEIEVSQLLKKYGATSGATNCFGTLAWDDSQKNQYSTTATMRITSRKNALGKNPHTTEENLFRNKSNNNFLKACFEGNKEKVKKLLDSKVDPNLVLAETDLPYEETELANLTGLDLACSKGHIEVCELLIARGADMSLQNNKSAGTCLHWACSFGRKEVVNLLLARGIDINIKDRAGNTALHRTAGNGMAEMCVLLIENGADVCLKNDAGETSSNRVTWPPALKDYLLKLEKEKSQDKQGFVEKFKQLFN